MAEHTYDELKTKRVAQLREIAQGIDHEAVKGYSQLNKDHLLPALCQALGIEAHEHLHVVGNFDKSAAKTEIRGLKAGRVAALEAHDHDRLKVIRRRHHRLNRKIRTHERRG